MSNSILNIVPVILLKMSPVRASVALFMVMMLTHPASREISRSALSDGFFQVSSFVAATLIVYQLISRVWQQTNVISDRRFGSVQEITIAACLGALPGCGGAIIVATQFTQGRASFAALVAVLCSTMGDAAFLLLAKLPIDGFTVIFMGIVTGIISGVITERMSPYTSSKIKPKCYQTTAEGYSKNTSVTLFISSVFWSFLLIPATIIAVTLSFQLDVTEAFGLAHQTQVNIGAACALTIVLFWLLNDQQPEDIKESNIFSESIKKTALITNSVSVWVFLSFLLFELLVLAIGENTINEYLRQSTSTPLLTAIVGLLPGCGPQIMVTNLYLQQFIPFSAQLSNAISNDGDALFPAIAIAPKAALLATVYTMVPALFVGYGYFYLFE